ncbi:MAG: TIM barrel protein [Spirochaetales bacterium]
MPKIGITSFVFRHRAAKGEQAEKLLDLAATAGVEVFQLCENTRLLEKSAHELDALQRRAETQGIQLEVGISGIENLGIAIEKAGYLKAFILRAVVDGGTVGLKDVERALKEVLPLLEKQNLYLCIENHFRFTPLQIVELIKKLAHPRVQVCLDPLNSIAQLVGPEETMRQLSPLAKTAHIKDGKILRQGTGWHFTGTPLGKGQVDLVAYLKSLPPIVESVLLESWMDPLGREEDTLKQEWEWVIQGMEWLKQHRNLIGNQKSKGERYE